MIKWLLLWVLALSLILFFMMWQDKRRAQLGRRRTPEAQLFLFAFLGGALGGWCGMHVFHHKTRKLYFRLGFPAIAIAQGVLLYLYWRGI